MDKSQALDEFWNSFEWKAYDEGTVPDDAEMPRITYNVVLDSLGNSVMMNASLWDRSTSWTQITQKADEISQAIETMYPPAIALDDGRMYITKGSPFAQRMQEPSDDMIRRIYLNIDVEYFTRY
jgi:hypothetical protein